MDDVNAKLRTRAIGHAETLLILQESLQRLTAARELLGAGESLAALRALIWISELNARAISTMLSACLQNALNDVEKADKDKSEKYLQDLNHLTGFALTALCFTCRRKVDNRLKRG